MQKGRKGGAGKERKGDSGKSEGGGGSSAAGEGESAEGQIGGREAEEANQRSESCQAAGHQAAWGEAGRLPDQQRADGASG